MTRIDSSFIDSYLTDRNEPKPIDFKIAQQSIIEIYKFLDFPPPSHFYIAKSPLHAKTLIDKNPFLRQDAARTRIKIKKKFIGRLRNTVVPKIHRHLNSAVWTNPTQLIYRTFTLDRPKYEDFIREVLITKSKWHIKVCAALHYPSFINHIVKNSEHFARTALTLFDNCGEAIFMYEDCVVFVQSYEYIKTSPDNLWHCETGPAVYYTDGFALFFWRGTQVPDRWILHKSTVDPSDILQWPNLEVRRAGCEIIGWDNILRTLPNTIIDKDPNPQIGTLVECQLPVTNILGQRNNEQARFLVVKCGTGRQFALAVPLDMVTAREAVAWTYGYDPDEYNPEVRT